MAARTLEMEFLPAALEVEQTPALPMARLMIWAIVLFFFVAITWACVSRVDIVGVAPGKIVPSGRTKTIQPLERSVVVAIHVADGQHVQAGEVLVELDPTAPTADRDRLSDEQMTYALDRTRLTGLLAAVRSEGGEVIETKPLPDPFGDLAKRAEPTLLGKQRAHFAEQLAEYRAAMAGLQEEIKQKQSERAGVESRIAQLDATLPLITEEADSNKKLMGGGMVPRVKWLELERNRIEQQQERDVQRHWHTQLGAVLASLAHKSQVTAAQYRSRWMSEQADAETRIASYSEEIAKAKHRIDLQTLTAPVAGTVQQLAVHTVGGVVTEAQPLMLLVPDDSPIEVEAMISNKDIGFIHEGQEAIVKIETFNFTKYGFVQGTVGKVSHDAIADKDHGLIYTAHITLGQTAMEIDGNTLQLAPGMVVSAEVKLGKRRVIEFLLSPLLRYQQESGRER